MMVACQWNMSSATGPVTNKEEEINATVCNYKVINITGGVAMVCSDHLYVLYKSCSKP
jgi:hypothetical protein